MATFIRTEEALHGQIVYDNTDTGCVGQLAAPGNFDTIRIHPGTPQMHGLSNIVFAFTFADIDSWVKARIEGGPTAATMKTLMEIGDAVYVTDGVYQIVWTKLGTMPYMRGVFVSESASPSDATCDLIVRAGA